MLVDSHAHLYWDSLKDDFEGVIQRAVEAGVKTIINVGTNLETSKIAAEQTSDKTKIYSTIGIHPHDIAKYLPNPAVSIRQDVSGLEELYKNKPDQIVAIGECGLDFHSVHSHDQIRDLQRKLFQAQIELAKRLNLPLVIHCRDAWDEILDYPKDCPGVLHCYGGTIYDTKKVLATSFFVSYAANITYPKNEQLRQTIKMVPSDRLLLETDSPFLAPEGKRDKVNEPLNILEVARTVSRMKNLPLEEIIQKTYDNARRLFRLS